jgi:dethiobiotin synthetase
MNVPGLCLLGTDTGVGKTTLGVGLLRLAKRKSVRLLPFKPVESGCGPDPSDVDRLVEAAAPGPRFGARDAGIYRFEEPIAPSIAARHTGQTIELDIIVQRARSILSEATALVVETAGGVLTPYGPGLNSTALVEALSDHFAFDVLLVGANRLGTINQTALALAHLARAHCRIAGVVLVDVHPDAAPDRPFNADEIRSVTGAAILGTLRYCDSPSPDVIADAVASDVDLRPLFGGALVA